MLMMVAVAGSFLSFGVWPSPSFGGKRGLAAASSSSLHPVRVCIGHFSSVVLIILLGGSHELRGERENYNWQLRVSNWQLRVKREKEAYDRESAERPARVQ